jgi:integrase
VLVKPDPKRRIGWRARYKDPDTGRTVWESLEPELRSADARQDWAVDKSNALAKRRLELEGGAVRATGTGLGAALARYFDDNPNLRPGTVGVYRRASDRFAEWCARHGVKSADDVNGPRLVAFKGWLQRLPLRASEAGAKRGARRDTDKRREPASVNRDLRAIGTILTHLRRAGLLPHVTGDALSDALRKLSGSVERIDFRQPPELRALLDSAARHDAATFAATRDEHAGKRAAGTTPRHKPIAPLVVAAMLTGMRLGELVGLAWERVDLDAKQIHIGAESKTHRARTVDLVVSPALVRMLSARRPKHAVGSVFGLTYGEAKAAEKRLRGEFGAPAGCGWQALRRTCGTFLSNAPGIFGAASAYRSAKQLGHSVVVAEKHYVGVVRIGKKARTLEAAMGVAEHPALA